MQRFSHVSDSLKGFGKLFHVRILSFEDLQPTDQHVRQWLKITK